VGCLSDEDVLDYVQDRLTPEVTGEFASHVDGCAGCRSLVLTLARAGFAAASPVTGDGTLAALAEPLLTAGSMLGRYRILEVRGAGGMGVVYSADDTELDRKVALKLLHAGAADPRGLLLREAQALARVSHQNVITVFEVGTFQDRVFVAMEFVDGWTLREWLASAKRTWREVFTACLQVGRGIAAAHGAGLVHRDLKPDNVLIGDDGWVRVTDFGLALMAGGAAEGAIAGTPAYMAPEQRTRGVVDARSDQYSFCVLMREALGARAAPVPGFISRVLSRGLSEDPSSRFESMGELLKALERAPVLRRRIGLALGGLVAAAAILTLISLRPPPCANVRDRVAKLYPPERAAGLRKTFEASGKPYAGAAFAEVDRVLTAWVARWSTSSVDACEATQIRHEQSAELMDLRNECLRRALGQAQALLEVFEGADAKLVERVGQAVHALPELAVCDDGTALRAGARRPADPKLRASLVPLEARLAQGAALRVAGKYKDAIALLEPLRVEATALGHAALLAEVHHALGDARESAGQVEAARADLNEAIRVSESVGNDLLKARAWVRLVFLEGNPARVVEGKKAAQMAEATLRRIGGGGVLGAQLAGARANLALIEGKEDEALKLIREAVALQQQHGALDDPKMSTVLLQLGNVEIALGDYRAAHAAFVRACEIDERVHGRDHPRLATCANNLSAVLCLFGRFDEAIVQARRSVELREKSLGKDHLLYAGSLCNLGEAQRGLGLLDEALASYQLALGARVKHGDENVVVVSAEDGIGMTLLAQGKPAEAEPHLLRALALNEKMYGPQSAEVSWANAQLAELRTLQGRAADALILAQSSLALREGRHAPTHPELARSLQVLGQAQLALGKPELARPPLERAVAISEASGLDKRLLAASQWALARALAPLPEEKERARTLARSAVAALVGSKGQERMLREAEAWLATP